MKSFRFLTLCFIISCFYLLIGCSKDPQTIEGVVARKEDPVMSARNIEVLFSDSGKLQARLISPLLNRYAGAAPYLEFPKGFKIFIFDSLQRVSSTITGNRGVRQEYTRTMEAWGNIVVRNEIKNEQLNTEHLIWDENRHKVWSDVKVLIIRPDQVITGSSMEANETFTSYSISNMSGEMMVKKDSI
ncbi:MAG: LPS export ABC transporter periplasmic protein LptC [Bacteroidota bacterium]